ncbi:adenylyl-sulfate kinase [Methylohalobius crimeensis]|uniref:adenylyl-sulfate kinase n=1 Tax=Methylohalobius crimeensis TaxID=244365 RepID=UPI0003B4A954|nr:adenylyl-sulfate kinase [Methylohalobius crimeensis]
MDKHIRWHQATVSRQDREQINGHRSFILWFTGLSGAGKSTLAHRVEELLYLRSCRTYVFDGDNVRHGLCSDLGFSPEERHENIRRIGEMSKLFIDAGVIALTAFISPFRRDREMVRSLVDEGDFIEIYCAAPLKVCEQRDVKGLYEKARRGEIKNFTGISSPYEPPENPEIMVESGSDSLDTCARKILDYLERHDKIALVPESEQRWERIYEN